MSFLRRSGILLLSQIFNQSSYFYLKTRISTSRINCCIQFPSFSILLQNSLLPVQVFEFYLFKCYVMLCYVTLHCIMLCYVKVTQLCPTWDFPGQNIGVCSCSLLHGIFPNQGLNSGLPHCKWILYQLSHQGSSHPVT